jgi:N-acetylneuraminic acid mutarotase
MKINKSFLCAVVVSSLLLSSCTKSTTTTLEGNWVRRSDFSYSARAFAVSFVINNTAYVMGGYGAFVDSTGKSTLKSLNDLYVYNLTKDSWTKKADFPGTGRIYATGFSANGKGYVCLGQDDNGFYLKDCWEYDPTLDKWTKKANFGSTPRYGAIGFGIGTVGYVGTGFDGGYKRDFWKFDPTGGPDGTWTQLDGDIPGQSRMGACSFIINGKAYIVGGINNGNMVPDFSVYDPAQNTWTGLRKITNSITTETFDDLYTTITREWGSAFVMNSKGYLTLGDMNGNFGSAATTWQYDPATDLWLQMTTFEGSSRQGAVAFTLQDGSQDRGFITTGQSGSYRFSDLWEFMPNDTYNAND